MSTTPSRAARAALGLALTAAIFELCCRLLLSSAPVLARLSELDDTARELAAVQRLRKLDGHATDFSARYPVAWHPVYGWTSRAGRFEADGHTLTVDERGMRALGPEAPAPGAQPRRALILGDSFGFGVDVGDADTFVAQLASPDLELLNLSVIGFGHDQMLLRLRHEGLAYHPDVVVLVFVSCDVPRNAQRFTTWRKPKFELHDGALVLSDWRPLTVAEVLAAHDLRPRALDLARLLTAATRRPQGAAEADALTRALLTQLAAEVVDAGALPVLVHAPILGEWALSPDAPRYAQFAGRQLVQRFCAETPGARCLDLFPAFHQAALAGTELLAGTHWSPAAHALIAEALTPTLAPTGDAP